MAGKKTVRIAVDKYGTYIQATARQRINRKCKRVFDSTSYWSTLQLQAIKSLSSFRPVHKS